jgi:hypothetical protein
MIETNLAQHDVTPTNSQTMDLDEIFSFLQPTEDKSQKLKEDYLRNISSEFDNALIDSVSILPFSCPLPYEFVTFPVRFTCLFIRPMNLNFIILPKKRGKSDANYSQAKSFRSGCVVRVLQQLGMLPTNAIYLYLVSRSLHRLCAWNL